MKYLVATFIYALVWSNLIYIASGENVIILSQYAHSMKEMNDFIQMKSNIIKCNSQDIISFQFSVSFIIDGTLDFSNVIIDCEIAINLRWFKGFSVNRMAPLVQTHKELHQISLTQGHLAFYNDHGTLLNGSCESILRSFFNLSADDYQRANKSELVGNYVSLFNFDHNMMLLSGNMAYDKLTCPLVFKGVQMSTMMLIKLQTTHISTNQITFDDSYDQIITNLNSNIIGIESLITYNTRIDNH